MLVKVCGLREESNVAQIISRDAPDFIGMIFYDKSPRYVGGNSAGLASIPGIPKVGVFVNASIDEIKEQQETYKFDYVQLHGNESLEFVINLKEQTSLKVIKVCSVSDRINLEELRPFEPYIEYFLFDTQTAAHGGSGRKFDWQVLEEYNLDIPYILSGGLDLEHAEEIISFYQQHPKMAGVDINSKFEISPGLKDTEIVKRFIKTIREKTNKSDRL